MLPIKKIIKNKYIYIIIIYIITYIYNITLNKKQKINI